jgi:hypothetical protein
MSPWCLLISIRHEISNPKPSALTERFGRKNGSKTRASISGAIPGLESPTMTTAMFLSVNVRMVSVPVPSCRSAHCESHFPDLVDFGATHRNEGKFGVVSLDDLHIVPDSCGKHHQRAVEKFVDVEKLVRRSI